MHIDWWVQLFLKSLSVGNADADAALEAKTIHLSAYINLLQSYVEEHALDKRSFNWKAVSTEAMNFPKLDEEHVRNLTYGVYQVKIPSHTRVYRRWCRYSHPYIEYPRLIWERLQSRHVCSKRHLLWIRYSDFPFIACYCKCRTGAHVVDVCFHIAAVKNC